MYFIGEDARVLGENHWHKNNTVYIISLTVAGLNSALIILLKHTKCMAAVILTFYKKVFEFSIKRHFQCAWIICSMGVKQTRIAPIVIARKVKH